MATANHVLLRRITLTASASSVTFDSIPQTGYTDLKIVMSARGDNGDDYFGLTFNGSSSNFTSKSLQGNGSSVSAAPRTDNLFVGTVVQSSLTANTFSSNEIYIPNYKSSNNKSFSIDAVQENNATSALSELFGGLWSNTAAITSIGFVKASGNFVTGSSFSLYGLADMNTTPTAAPKADGGDIIKTDGTYWYHAFTGSGIFKPQLNLTCDYLVIAGGGSGGGGSGYETAGGGGAGGLLYSTNQTLSVGNYSVVVGAGGAGTPVGAYTSNVGSNSVFNGTTTIGGGGGGWYSVPVATSGGSGGGGRGGVANSGGAGTSGQGYAGGTGGGSSSESSGGGGGGAGAVGGAASNNYSGDGGVGVTSSLFTAMGSATSTGQLVSGSYYYAGGGGGGISYTNGYSGGRPGNGGNGGGGTGGNNNGVNGTMATGGGGGGGGSDDGKGGTGSGGAGGSGIVIIRYTVA